MAAAAGKPTPDQVERFDAVYNRTMARPFLRTDRLVLLLDGLDPARLDAAGAARLRDWVPGASSEPGPTSASE